MLKGEFRCGYVVPAEVGSSYPAYVMAKDCHDVDVVGGVNARRHVIGGDDNVVKDIRSASRPLCPCSFHHQQPSMQSTTFSRGHTNTTFADLICREEGHEIVVSVIIVIPKNLK